jgi:hypothetical protein
MGFPDDDKSLLQAVLECAGYDPFARKGKEECLAVEVDTCGEFFADILTSLQDWDEGADQTLATEMRDMVVAHYSVGMMVVYFPGIPYLSPDGDGQ